MKSRSLRALGVVFVALALSCSRSGPGAPSTSSAPSADPDAKTVAATAAGKAITIGEIDAAIRADLARVEMQRYEARREHLERWVDQTLVEKKAADLGVSDEQLFKTEIADKVKQPDDAAVKAYFEEHKDRIGSKLEEVAPRIQKALSSDAVRTRQRAFVGELRKQYGVSIALQPPRTEVSTAGGQSKGSKDAPIVLVEFSDYQCPFCARSQEIVDKVVGKYGDKVRHVFMDFPIAQIHPRAMPAAVAGRCAGEQDKFWDLHKLLFQNQRDLTDENFKKWAGELKLDVAKFETCLTGGGQEAAIELTMDAGQKIGVTGTPAFFVNGVMVSGAQPFEVFEQIIDGELERTPG